MKKAAALLLTLLTASALLFTVVFYICRNDNSGGIHIRTLDSHNPTAMTVQDPSASAVSENGRVDINKADLDTLMTLPGIGQTLANRIIDYRNTHGPYESVAGLLNVEGIGAGKLESILNLITTGGTT